MAFVVKSGVKFSTIVHSRFLAWVADESLRLRRWSALAELFTDLPGILGNGVGAESVGAMVMETILHRMIAAVSAADARKGTGHAKSLPEFLTAMLQVADSQGISGWQAMRGQLKLVSSVVFAHSTPADELENTIIPPLPLPMHIMCPSTQDEHDLQRLGSVCHALSRTSGGAALLQVARESLDNGREEFVVFEVSLCPLSFPVTCLACACACV